MFPTADIDKMGPIIFSNKNKTMEIVIVGPRGGNTKIALDYGSGLRSDTMKENRRRLIVEERLAAENVKN